MSYFDNKQLHLLSCIKQLEKVNPKKYSEATREELLTAIQLAEATLCYLIRLDMLLEGTSSESRFHEKLQEDLKLLGDKYGDS